MIDATNRFMVEFVDEDVPGDVLVDEMWERQDDGPYERLTSGVRVTYFEHVGYEGPEEELFSCVLPAWMGARSGKPTATTASELAEYILTFGVAAAALRLCTSVCFTLSAADDALPSHCWVDHASEPQLQRSIRRAYVELLRQRALPQHARHSSDSAADDQPAASHAPVPWLVGDRYLPLSGAHRG